MIDAIRSNYGAAATDGDVEGARMSFGDHLDELRARLIKALGGVLLASVITLILGKSIVEFICRPLWVVQHANGLQPQLQSLSPTAAFTTYMKISFLSGLILAMPWVLHQVWSFVVTGLYRNERKFVRFVIPISAGLFALGVLFLYYLILPLVLQFFIGFNSTFGVSDLTPHGLQGLFLPTHEFAAEGQGATGLTQLRMVAGDPPDAKAGDVWVNSISRRLVLKTDKEVWSMPWDLGTNAPLMQNFFAIDAYISFVLVLALGFGLAFETPIVVFFLAWTGLVSVEAMVKARRIVVLATVFVAAVITPPDPMSLMLLAIPMYALFEGGVLAARLWVKKNDPANATSTPAK